MTAWNLVHISTGDDFIQLPPDLWLDPSSIHAESHGDTLQCRPGARGSIAGLLLYPVPEPGDTVYITADTLSVNAQNTAELNLQPAHSESMYEMNWRGIAGDPVPEGLFISGSKQLGVSIGSGGGITQGTELSIQGMLSPGITVDGRITDRNLPLGAASSEALSELDKVYMSLDGGSWNAEMGDLKWENNAPVGWSADPSGFHLGVSPLDSLSFTGGYGTTGSERHTAAFLTLEGVQGPYQFAPEGGVTPGSEQVYLDGELMTRGAGSDYTVEYSAGQITFNTGRLIVRDQRVDVSWYREGDGFRKNLYTGGMVVSPWESGSLAFKTFFRGDDVTVPLGFVMSREVEEILAAAGDDPLAAWIDGGTQVGDGNGSYTRDSLQIYHWAGPGQGDWSVEFQRPPEGPGDYLYDSTEGGYVWAGDSMGTHYPRRYLSIPASSGIITAELSGSSGAVESYALHSTFSESSGNLFNTQETTRQGTLSGGSVALRPWEKGPLLALEGRFVSSGFAPPEKLDRDSELLRWGLPAGWQGNDSYGLAGLHSSALSFVAGSRRFQTGGSSSIAEASFTGQTGLLVIDLSANGLFRNDAAALSQGKRGMISADLSVSTGFLTPFLTPSYTAESWPDSLSGALASLMTGVRLNSDQWHSEISAGGDIDRRWGVTHPEKTLRVLITGAGSAVNWNGSGSVAHSTGWYSEGASTSSDAIRISWSGRFGGTWIHTKYTAGGYISREMDIIYIWVGEGNGDYSYDPETGEYYADPSGDYKVSWVPGQGDTQVLEASLAGGFSWSDSSASTGIDGSFTFEASDPENRLLTYTTAGAFNAENPGSWTAAISPWITWDQGLISRFSLKLEGYDSVDQVSGSGIIRETRRLLELSPVLTPYENVLVEVSGWTSSSRQTIYADRRMAENGLSIDPVYLFSGGFEAGIELSGERRSEENLNISGTAWGIDPHSTVSSSGWSARLRFASTLVSSEDNVPSWLFDGMPAGWTIEPNLSVSRNLSEWLRLTVYYRGRKRPDSEWDQRGGMEGTVNF